MNPTFMIVPSSSCQASCKYCFGPHAGAVMDQATAEETVSFIHSIAQELCMTEISVIFHGGEPLLAPVEIWETLLEGLSRSPGGVPVSLSVQSNLWRLDETFIALFKKYRVSVGTSLDGPRSVCDLNRGEGYFDRTMSSVQKAEQCGIQVGAIATLTKQTVPQAREILTFFRDRGLNPVLHAAVKAMNRESDPYSLSANEYADAVIGLYPWYVSNRKYFSVPTLDNYCKAVVLGDPHVCTMCDCLGMFLAISPTGDITGCQRMAGMPAFRYGNVFDRPSMAQLTESDAWKKLENRQRQVSDRCGECAWLDICRGGCYYNALSAGDEVVDPLCGAYKRIYAFLQERVSLEAGSKHNIAAMKRRPPEKDENPFLRDGPYISLTGKMHPSAVAENARLILASYMLGKYGEPDEAAKAMTDRRYCADSDNTRMMLSNMKNTMRRKRIHFNNCYIHTTFRCNLRCTHCYALAGEDAAEMAPDDMERLAEEALALGFRQLVITGGEPLFHRDWDKLIALCRRLRGRGSNIVLRTNLTGSFSEDQLRDIMTAFDQVVVSVDGNEETHDARRGKGTYRNVCANCERYAALAQEISQSGELSLACVMNADKINGAPGQSLRALGNRLGVARVRFRPLLPLGRAARAETLPFSECISQHEPIEDILRVPFRPMMSCGIGQNIYIRPDGEAYPCYAWQTEHSYLGNVLHSGLGEIMGEQRFTRLRDCTVDTIEKCRDCELRYLCGGACRAWGNREETDPNTAPPECSHLRKRAYELIGAAEKYLLK